MTRLLTTFGVLAALLAVSLLSDRPLPRADLTLGYIQIETLDGPMMQAHDDVLLGYALYEGLLTFDPTTFETVPGVAESHTISKDRKTYTFRLRPDAKWSDGHPVTAEDFLFSWWMSLLPDTAPPYQSFLYPIRGARDYSDWAGEELARVNRIKEPQAKHRAARARIDLLKEKFAERVGVRSPDPHTIVIELAKPVHYFEEMVACWPLFPLPKHILEPRVAIDPATAMLRRDPQWTKPDRDPETMITNGPYRLAAWRFKREIYLEANAHYWNKTSVLSSSVRLVNFKDYNTMFLAYTSGSLDVLLGATPLKYAAELIAAQKDGRRRDVHPRNAFATYFYTFNARPTLSSGAKNPFADPRVRHAFALAVDKQAIVENVTRLNQQVADHVIPPGAIPGYRSPKGASTDLDAARRLLAEAGYPNGAGFPEVSILYNTGSGHENVAQAVGKMWERNLGVRVAPPEGQEWKIVLKRRTNGEFMIVRAGWFGDYMDPTTFLELFRTGFTNNDGGVSDPKYDAMLAEAAKIPDPKQRLKRLSEIERYALHELAPILPLYYYQVIHLFDPDRVEGVSEHARDLQFFHRIKVKRP